MALVETRGNHGLLIARKHMGWTCTGFPGAPQLRHALMRAPTPAEALALLDRQRELLSLSTDRSMASPDQGNTSGQHCRISNKEK